jgi:hypothetical protein
VRKKITRTGRVVKVPAKKVRGKVVRKAYSYKKPRRNKTAKRKMTRNAIPRWEVSVHPGTGKRGIKGQKMSVADRKKWTKRGVLRSGIGRFVKKGKKVQAGARGKAAAGHWKRGVVHPVTGRAVGGQVMSARDKALFKSDGTTRKGVGPAAVRAAYGKGTPRKPKKAVAKKPAAKKTTAKRKTVKKKTAAKRRKTRGKRYRVRKPGGRGTYLRRYPKRRKAAAKKKKAVRRGKYTTVKVPAKRSRSGKILRKAYSYKRKATAKRKPAKRKAAKRRTARRYRVRKPGGGTYLRRYPTKRRKPAKRKTAKRRTYKRKTAKRAYKRRTARRYRVRKPGGRGTYLRRYPKRRKAKGRKKATYYRKRANGRRKGKIVRVKGYTRSDGKRVKGYSYRLKKTGRKGRVTRNPYKRRKVSRKAYSYTRTRPRRKRVSVPRGKRRQWYPHHYGGRWITNKKAARLGLLNKHEKRALMKRHGSAALVANPSALAMLPTSEQLMSVGKAAGLGFVGFGAAVAAGRALNRVTMISQHTGAWTPVVGNIAAGLGFWAVASYLDDERLNAMKPFVAAGAGLAAIVNVMLNLIGRQIIPSNYASWILPGSGSVAVAPDAAVEPDLVSEALVNGNGNGNGTGFGQIDIYEAALDGVGGIEEELEMELDRLSGDGIFDAGAEAGIFSGLDGTGTPVEEAYAGMNEYLEVPMGASVEEAYAGMGANVEEAYAGMNEYLEVPMSEYLEVPMSEYLEVPMSEYLEVPMGASVEEAYAGMGQTPAAVESSIRNRPLMPGFKGAVQKMVQQRIASGKPIDQAFYRNLGQAAAKLARKKFDQRVRQVGGRPAGLPKEPWKAPLLRRSAPMYKRPVADPQMAPGSAERIPTRGPGNQGIFSDEDNDGIF